MDSLGLLHHNNSNHPANIHLRSSNILRSPKVLQMLWSVQVRTSKFGTSLRLIVSVINAFLSSGIDNDWRSINNFTFRIGRTFTQIDLRTNNSSCCSCSCCSCSSCCSLVVLLVDCLNLWMCPMFWFFIRNKRVYIKR